LEQNGPKNTRDWGNSIRESQVGAEVRAKRSAHSALLRNAAALAARSAQLRRARRGAACAHARPDERHAAVRRMMGHAFLPPTYRCADRACTVRAHHKHKAQLQQSSVLLKRRRGGSVHRSVVSKVACQLAITCKQQRTPRLREASSASRTSQSQRCVCTFVVLPAPAAQLSLRCKNTTHSLLLHCTAASDAASELSQLAACLVEDGTNRGLLL
jgi:hypothetical protein